jgi:hypothetical protein
MYAGVVIYIADSTPDEQGLVYADPWLLSAAVRTVCRSFVFVSPAKR